MGRVSSLFSKYIKIDVPSRVEIIDIYTNAYPTCPIYPQKSTKMKARLMAPIESIQGKIAPGYYARIMYGKQVIQRCPVRTKPATEKQKAARQWFADNLSGRGWLDVASGNRVVCEESR